MFEINGLPVHVLLVHVTVIIVPLAALCTVLSVLWPTARRRLGIVTPVVALIALIAVPITTSAGKWLQERVPSTPLITTHAALGDTLLPWVIAVFVAALAQWVWYRSRRSAQPEITRRLITVVIALAAAAASVGATLTVVQVGESGSRAVWQGSFRQTP